jgi:GNAT superfamily N-acetyltransferase
MSARVRVATPHDYEALCGLFRELDEFHVRARPDFFKPIEGPARTREQVDRWLADPGSTILVAEVGTDIVGLAVLLTRPPSPFAGAVPRKVIELDNLVVRGGLRSRGIGRSLLEAMMDWSREQGATHIEVAVHAVNGAARRFYRRFGFSPSIERLVVAA